jgi:type I restriction enzyme S subunit
MTNIPYKLPDGWKWVKLDEVCIINPRRPRILREPNKPTTFIPMSAVDDETGTITAAEVRPFKQVSKGYTYFEENDILFAKITPCMENGKAAIARGLIERIGFGSTEFHVLRPKPIVLPEWVWLFVRRERFREDAKKFFRGGVGQQRVPQEFLEQYLIPLPPLEEQKRIVARIEELMTRIKEARKLRQESKEKAELLWQSALAETFPKPGTQLPNSWKWVRLSEITKGLESGKRPKGGVKKITNGIPSIGGEHITWDGGFDFSKIRYVSKEFYCSLRKGKINKGDILIVKDGATTGKTAYVSETFPFKDACINEHVYILRVNENLSISRFVFLFLISPVGQSQIKKTFHGAAQGGINSEFINQVEIPLPPLEEQKRIVAHLQALQEKIKSLKESQTHTETKLKELENSILDKAFKGEL